MDKGISIFEGALWVLAWFGVMLFYTLLDVTVWRKAAPRHAGILNLFTVSLCMGGFLVLLKTKGRFELDLTCGVTLQGILLALGCAVAMYFLLDKWLDPIFEGLTRGFLLGGLSASYGNVTALLLSSALFALLHFNMVQTLSALISGIVLGLIYIRTGSVACCIAAHAGYNMISYFTAISRDPSRVS